MQIHIQTANAFTTTCRKLGVIKPNVGLNGLRDLIELSKAPAPARPIDHNRRSSFCDLKHVGVLIAQNLAAFNRQEQHYEITDEGRSWLQALQSHGIISQH